MGPDRRARRDPKAGHAGCQIEPTIFCTNLPGAPLAEELERELGIPVYDSIATVVWKSLKLAGVDTRRVRGWGRLFREV